VPELIEQNIVVVGSLNPTILHPNWMVDQRLISKGSKAGVKFQIGTSFPVEYDCENYRWTVDFSRLKVNVPPSESPILLSQFIDTVFKELPHTPISAIGHNFVYEDSNKSLDVNFDGKIGWKIGGKMNWGTPEVIKNEVKISIDEISQISISLNKNREKIQISFNFNFDTNSTNRAREFAKLIDSNYKKTEAILKEILQ